VQGKFDEAVKNYRQSLTFKPHDAYLVYYKLGNTLRLQGKLNEAISQYQKALKLKPNYTNVHYNLGLTHMLKGDKNSALKQYKILKYLDNNVAEQLFKHIHK